MASSANGSLEIVHPQQTQSRALLFAPNNMQELMKMSDLLATSDLVPKQYKGKPADIVVAAMYGAELGLPLLQALNSVLRDQRAPRSFRRWLPWRDSCATGLRRC